MQSFSEYFYDRLMLEYRHFTSEGLPKDSIEATNGKNPNIINKKNLHNIGPYKPKNNQMHRVGAIFSGPQLTNVLLDYNLEFKDGQVSQIKNSPMAIQMYMNAQGQPTGRIIKTK